MKTSVNATLADFLEVSYCSIEHIIVFRWRCLLLGDELFSASYETLLAFAVRHNCPYWIVDLRRHPIGPIEQSQQGLKDFCTQVRTVFPPDKTVHASYLVAPSALAHYAELFSTTLPFTTKRGYHAAAFVDEGSANAWIKQWQMP